MTREVVRPISTAPDQLIEPDAATKSVRVIVRKTITPDRARLLATELLYAADAAEGEDGEFGFGYDPNDAQELCELRSVMDDLFGWKDDEQQLDGDYVERLREVGREWRIRCGMLRSMK